MSREDGEEEGGGGLPNGARRAAEAVPPDRRAAEPPGTEKADAHAAQARARPREAAMADPLIWCGFASERGTLCGNCCRLRYPQSAMAKDYVTLRYSTSASMHKGRPSILSTYRRNTCREDVVYGQ